MSQWFATRSEYEEMLRVGTGLPRDQVFIQEEDEKPVPYYLGDGDLSKSEPVIELAQPTKPSLVKRFLKRMKPVPDVQV